MGKSSQIAADHDAGGDRITARVGSRTKKAKVVFDPSDHHVPRKRNRRGEGEFIVTGTPKSESIRTATPSSSSSSTDGSNNHHVPTATATTPTSFRFCQKCGRNGPGRMPRKTAIAPWTCPSCLADMNEKSFKTKHNHSRTAVDRATAENDEAEEDEEEEEEEQEEGEEEEEEEEDEEQQQQQDFAGFSETELSGHGNENDNSADERLSVPVKYELDVDSDDGGNESRGQLSCKQERADDSDGERMAESLKEIRYWSCDDVCQYFGRHCKAWADLFHEQEIDGPSLLLMRRGDVLSRFGLKLGPAMELYQRIVALQNGDRDIVDVRLTWM